MNLNKRTAFKIRALRHRLGYTVEAMAKDLNISKTAYSRMENGHIEITLSKIEALAHKYNIAISDIVPATKTDNTIKEVINSIRSDSRDMLITFELLRKLIKVLEAQLENEL